MTLREKVIKRGIHLEFGTLITKEYCNEKNAQQPP
jgi:hypothetical protein